MESRSTMLSKSLPNSLYKVMLWSEGKHDPRHPAPNAKHQQISVRSQLILSVAHPQATNITRN